MQLRDAVAAVLSDFPEGESVQLTVAWTKHLDGQWWRRLETDGSYSEGPCAPQDEPELLIDIAYFLQDFVFDTEPWGEARPVCPGHAHPPDPRIIDGKAVWICPADGRVLAPIGRLR